MDVDHIPAGVDFVAHLNSQVAACNVLLVVIGPHWLDAKDEAGQRRINQLDDFVAIEIAAALARNIRVIPVMVDGANIPKASDLPDSLKPLARRQAIEVRQTHFGRDADPLVERVGEALGTPGRSRTWTFGAIAAAVLILFGIGVGSYTLLTMVTQSNQQQAAQAEAKRQAEQAQQAGQTEEAKRQAEQAQQQAQAEEAKRQAEQAEQAARAEEAKRQAEQAQQQAQAEQAKRQAEQQQKPPPKTPTWQQTPSTSTVPQGAWIGLRIHAVTEEIAEGLNIIPPRGALVIGVDENGPAKAGGILVGDVLLKFDGHDIQEMRDFPRMVAGAAVGQQAEIVLSRRGNKETHSVTIGPLKSLHFE